MNFQFQCIIMYSICILVLYTTKLYINVFLYHYLIFPQIAIAFFIYVYYKYIIGRVTMANWPNTGKVSLILMG